MSIPSQLPSIPLAQASADLRALAQMAGQSIDARVGTQLPNGLTQVLVGRQTLALQLPAPQTPGTVLTLAVQQAEGQLRLALVSVKPPQATTPPLPQQGSATTVQLSAAALAQPTPTAPVPVIRAAPAPSATVPLSGAQPSPVPAVPGSGQPPLPGPAPLAPAPAALPTGPTPGAISVGTTQPAAATILAAGPAPAANPVTVSAQVAPARPSSPPTSPTVNSAPRTSPELSASLSRQAMPYPAAAGAPPAGQASANTFSQPVQQATPTTSVGQHPAAPAGAQPGAVAARPLAAAPNLQAALNQMVHTAAPRQDSVLSLLSAMTAIAGKVAVPEPVAKAMQQVLAQRVTLDGPRVDGTVLQKAVQQSGIFQEALIASGQARGAAGDMKSSLLGLQRQLLSWLGNQAEVEQVSSLAPPVRGQVPRARPNAAAPRSLPLEPLDAGKVLLERTDAALSRLRLHQNASLPEPAARQDGAQWSLDLPVLVGGQQALLHMQIHRDPHKEDARPEDRGWQVKFAMHLDEVGEVGAQISLRGATAGVLIWADRAETAAMLSANLDALRADLAEVGLAPGSVLVRAGTPAAPPQVPSAAGHFVDATR